jgi:hypothetical protein
MMKLMKVFWFDGNWWLLYDGIEDGKLDLGVSGLLAMCLTEKSNCIVQLGWLHWANEIGSENKRFRHLGYVSGFLPAVSRCGAWVTAPRWAGIHHPCRFA